MEKEEKSQSSSLRKDLLKIENGYLIDKNGKKRKIEKDDKEKTVLIK